MLKASDFSIFLNSSSRQQGFPLRVTLENLIFSPKQPDCPRDCHKYVMNILATQIQRFTLCRIDSATIHYSEIAHILESNLKYVLVDMNILWVSLSISRPDMEFVQNFTPLDFQAKNFTPSISPNFNSFSKEKTQKMSENGEIYTAGKNFTLPPALTAWTNSTSGIT